MGIANECHDVIQPKRCACEIQAATRHAMALINVQRLLLWRRLFHLVSVCVLPLASVGWCGHRLCLCLRAARACVQSVDNRIIHHNQAKRRLKSINHDLNRFHYEVERTQKASYVLGG